MTTGTGNQAVTNPVTTIGEFQAKSAKNASEPVTKPVTSWQPIETAPKDGDDVLLWVIDSAAEGWAEVGYWGRPQEGGENAWVDHGRCPIASKEFMLAVVAWKRIEPYAD